MDYKFDPTTGEFYESDSRIGQKERYLKWAKILLFILLVIVLFICRKPVKHFLLGSPSAKFTGNIDNGLETKNDFLKDLSVKQTGFLKGVILKEKAYFYLKPSQEYKTDKYLIKHNKVHVLDSTKYYFYVSYTSSEKITTKGYIKTQDIAIMHN